MFISCFHTKSDAIAGIKANPQGVWLKDGENLWNLSSLNGEMWITNVKRSFVLFVKKVGMEYFFRVIILISILGGTKWV